MKAKKYFYFKMFKINRPLKRVVYKAKKKQELK